MSNSIRHFDTHTSEYEALPCNRSHSSDVFVEFPREEIDQSVSERFEKIARFYPERLAVKAGNQTLTYDALNRMANQIARTLFRHRRQPRETVAFLFDHGVHVIAALFGGLKAGELNVVLDSSSPRDRNEHLLADCDPSLIVTDNRNLALARRLAGHRGLLNIEEMADSHAADNLVFHPAPDEIAIMNYTTGSTGEPKGVAKTHLELLDSCFTQINTTKASPGDRISLLHSLSFSTAYTNLMAALMSGASIFPFEIQAQGIRDFIKWLREEQITMCHLPPGVFRQLADSHLGQAEFPHLRLIRLSGSLIKRKDFELYKKAFPDTTRLMISMGSTESRGICSAVIDQTFSFPREGTPLGYPVPGKKILLLDEQGREVSRGQMGEIAVKSRYLTTGYWKQPKLTGNRLVSNSEQGKERIYLTGD